MAHDRFGKTLTSFKAARLATQLDFIDKVFFVVDRKDLDYQTMKEYQRFSPDSVNGSESTAGLKRNIDKDDNKIIVTTIQKLNNLMKSEDNLPVYQKQVVFILMRLIALSSERLKNFYARSSRNIISSVLRGHRYSRKMHSARKQLRASLVGSCMLM